MSIEEIRNILGIYSLEEVIELNDTTVEDILYYLVTEGALVLPDPEPL